MSGKQSTNRPVVIAFWLYAIALFIATHYPRLAIESPINNTDKAIHLAAFGLWTILFGLAYRFHMQPPVHRSDTPTHAPPHASQQIDTSVHSAPPTSPRPGPFLRLPAIASLYAIVDESLQAIPALGRTFSLADMTANLLGVLGGTLLILTIRLRIAARPRS